MNMEQLDIYVVTKLVFRLVMLALLTLHSLLYFSQLDHTL